MFWKLCFPTRGRQGPCVLRSRAAKQSFGDKGVPTQEFGHEGGNVWTAAVEVTYGGEGRMISPQSSSASDPPIVKTTRLLTASAAVLCAFAVTPARAALSFVQNFGSLGSGSGQFNYPAGVTVDSAGNVYVADYNNSRIERFNPTNFAGTFTSFGSLGSGSGQFTYLYGVTVDSAGKVYVADTVNHRIDRFNPTNFAGTFTSFGSLGGGSGQFNTPTGVTVDGAGNVYVAD